MKPTNSYRNEAIVPRVTKYVCGFLFSDDQREVLLIRKKRPDWQKGLLNGVGGKIHRMEYPKYAMTREFQEEAGKHITTWQRFAVLRGPAIANTDDKCRFEVSFFRAFGNVRACEAKTDESLVIVNIDRINWHRSKTVPNLRWLIPMALEDLIVNGIHRLETSVCY